MSDYASFLAGAITYPLPASGSGIGGAGASLLRDGDPCVFYVLEFYKKMLETHLGTRFLAEAVSAGSEHLTSIVAETLPLNPEPFLAEEHIKFPLLAAYRKDTQFKSIGQQKIAVDSLEVVYVLPPLQAAEAERLLPMLKSVVNILDNRTEQGWDATYTPSAPTGSVGDLVWDRAGVARAEIKSASYGSYAPTADIYFPCVIMQLEIEEQAAPSLAELEVLNGVNADIDFVDSVQETVVASFAQIKTWPAPTLTSRSPSTGTKAGGTSVTLTGTGFQVGTLPVVTFGGIRATAVNVVSSTSITCVTPAHEAFPTFAADIELTNIDGQSDSLEASYTFTTP